MGTTTIRLGVTRHGPLAPEACQFGKYDAFTRTGEPGRSTSKEMRSSPVRMLLTLVARTGMRSACWIWTPAPTLPGPVVGFFLTVMRCHGEGPSAARGTAQVWGSCWYQSTATSSQSLALLGGFLRTAGCSVSGATSAESLTSKISHGFDDATRRRFGLAWAWASASGEKAM